MNPKRHLGRFRTEAQDRAKLRARGVIIGPRIKPEKLYKLAVALFHGFMAHQPDVTSRRRSDYPSHVDYAVALTNRKGGAFRDPIGDAERARAPAVTTSSPSIFGETRT